MLEFLFNKVAGLQVCNFIKKRLKHRCFPVKFAKYFKKTSGDCFCSWENLRLTKVYSVGLACPDNAPLSLRDGLFEKQLFFVCCQYFNFFYLTDQTTEIYINAGLITSKKIFIYFNENPLTMMKYAFYFILKALCVLKICVLIFWLCRKDGLIRNIRLISKLMTSQPG